MNRYLISTAELAACYQNSDTVVVDCRFALADSALGETQYRAGHIPGGHYLHLDRDLSGEKGIHGGRHPLPDFKKFADTMSAIGVDSATSTLVVAYDDSRFAFAARLWWLLRYCGHDNVKVLNGGYAAWCAAQQPISTALPESKRGNFVALPRESMLIARAAVREINQRERAVLIDSREQRRYLGLEEPIDPVAGHIEGAVNYPWQQVTHANGEMLPLRDQQLHWQKINAANEIAVYCGSGVTACVNLLSLAQIGRDDAKLYAGSWSDWCSYPENFPDKN